MVPRSTLAKGVAVCLTVAEQRLAEARALLDAGGYSDQTAIVFSFAIEEFGKVALLREAYDSGQDPIAIEGFYEHDAKLEAASRYIPEENLYVSRGAFQRGAFQSNAFDVGTPVELSTSLSGLYVDWKGGDWRHGIRAHSDEIYKNLSAVQTAILLARIDWRF